MKQVQEMEVLLEEDCCRMKRRVKSRKYDVLILRVAKILAPRRLPRGQYGGAVESGQQR